jgi:hypothetical protein
MTSIPTLPVCTRCLVRSYQPNPDGHTPLNMCCNGDLLKRFLKKAKVTTFYILGGRQGVYFISVTLNK